MYSANVTFKDIEQERRVFKLFLQVLNGQIKLEQLTIEEMRKEFDIEDIAVFFELMAKHLDSKQLKPENEAKIK